MGNYLDLPIQVEHRSQTIVDHGVSSGAHVIHGEVVGNLDRAFPLAEFV
jgi:hypothetical protein